MTGVVNTLIVASWLFMMGAGFHPQSTFAEGSRWMWFLFAALQVVAAWDMALKWWRSK